MMASSGYNGGSAPQSVEQITRIAQDYDYNPLVPLRYWLRTAGSLVKEAEIYEREGRDEQAYLLLFRHAQLVLVNLVKHPERKEEQNRKGLLEAEKQVKVSIAKLESLKPRINKRYERYKKILEERDARKLSSKSRGDGATHSREPSDPALSGVAKPLEAGENRELAVRLATSEISRRALARKATRQAGISEEVEHQRRTGGVWGDWEQELTENDRRASDELSRRIQQVRTNFVYTDGDSPQHSPTSSRHSRRSSPLGQPAISAYKYPSVPHQKNVEPPSVTSAPTQLLNEEAPSGLPPLVPPKEHLQKSLSVQPPPVPIKLPRPSTGSTPVTPTSTSPNGQDVQTSLNPSAFTFKPSAYLENGTPLRTLFLPPNLREHFLSIAAPNTRRNLETCGILCGTLISNALFVSKLLIPEQESTSDTCETVNESTIFDYCEKEDLMVLGWIHTHPTQTCFMSSRDLHTHGGYQVMLPESIAIVCAPSKEPSWGVFRLTDPPGLKSILNCTQRGLFHPHAERNIYTDALRPGHVFEAKGLEFETVDLRPGR